MHYSAVYPDYENSHPSMFDISDIHVSQPIDWQTDWLTLQSNPEYNPSRCHAFVHDLSDVTAVYPMPEQSLDVIVLIFVLSALHPEKWVSRWVREIRIKASRLSQASGVHVVDSRIVGTWHEHEFLKLIINLFIYFHPITFKNYLIDNVKVHIISDYICYSLLLFCLCQDAKLDQ